MSVDYVNSVDHKFRAMIGENLKLEVKKGVKSVSFLNQTSNNNLSTTSTQYDFTLNQNQILCDYMVERCTFNVAMTFTVANNAAVPEEGIAPFVQGNIAPRVLPLTNASQSISIRLNSQSITVDPQDIITPLLSFNKPNSYVGRDLPCAGTIDTTTDFASGAVNFDSEVGSLKNPLLDYFSSTSGFNPRFSDVEVSILQNLKIAKNTSGTLNFQFTTHEPIFTGVTSLSLDQMSGFTGLTSVNITRNFVSNLVERLINWVSPNQYLTLTNTVVSLATVPVLFYALYTPESDYLTTFPQYYPMVNYYLSRTPNTGGQVMSAVTNVFNFNSGNISLSQVPRCIYVWCALPNAGKHSAQSDAPGMYITNMNLTYGGQSGQFSSIISRQEFYQHFMSSQGSIIQYHESGYISYINGVPVPDAGPNVAPINSVGLLGGFGTVLRIDATQLGGIDWNNYSVGSPFNSQLTITCTATAMGKTAWAQTNPQIPNLFVLVVNEKTLRIDGPSSATLVDGLLDAQTVASIRATGKYEYQDLPMMGGGRDMNRHKRKIGAGIWDKLKHIGRFAWNNKDHIVNVGKAAAPLFGGKKKSSKRRMYGGSLDESDSEDEYCGGALVSKIELQRRLK
jgi:hypothetical protein